ncbi:DUF397 domain-containing protein [Streptomyces sp. B1I3]|uniref:DUF397 domain-containing protein n=1 Tax=Streptomyces sp. B1I3 TaxID=3042264 RepID=UPI00277DB354|nr:DUF397 domain-containing protein [Streptomyces sp. B1I3]MDQ0797064.1 hypothetical protein [Streptomyces sp. B1I3]
MSIDGAADSTGPLTWSKSSHSSNEGGACVEVAATEHIVLVRDSKDTARPHLTLSPAGWADFVRYAAGV